MSGQLPPGQLPPRQLPSDNCPPDNSYLGQLPTRIIATQSTAPWSTAPLGQLPPRKIAPWTIADSGQLHITGRIPICYTTILQYVPYRKTLEQQMFVIKFLYSINFINSLNTKYRSTEKQECLHCWQIIDTTCKY